MPSEPPSAGTRSRKKRRTSESTGSSFLSVAEATGRVMSSSATGTGPTGLEHLRAVHGPPRLIFRKAMTRVLNRQAESREPPFTDGTKVEFWKLVREEVQAIVNNIYWVDFHSRSIERMCDDDEMVMVHPKYQMSKTKDLLGSMGLHYSYLVDIDKMGSVESFAGQIWESKFKQLVGNNRAKKVGYGGENIRFKKEGWSVGPKHTYDPGVSEVMRKINEEAKVLFKDCVQAFNKEQQSKGYTDADKVYDDSREAMMNLSLLWSKINPKGTQKNSEEQQPHCDYHTKEVKLLHKETGLKPLSTFCPVTLDGMALRAWSKDKVKAPILFVPLGVVLYLWGIRTMRGDSVSGPETTSASTVTLYHRKMAEDFSAVWKDNLMERSIQLISRLSVN
jgi:hypothetical protein